MNKWLLALCLFWSAAQAFPVYRWVDDNGQAHYSDRPGPGAVRIDLPADAPSTTAGQSSPRARSSALAAQATHAGSAPAESYEWLAVIQPARRETLWGTGGSVEIAIGVFPDLQPLHRLGLYVDGVRTDLQTRATRFLITDVHRGEHTVRAVILDGENNEVLQSAPVTFFVQQTSIHYPRNPGRAR